MSNIFSTQNKVTRLQYTLAFLFAIVLTAILQFNLMNIVEFAKTETQMYIIIYGISFIIGFMMLTFMVWRINDIGKSRWYLLLAFIPLVNSIFGLVLCFYPPNKSQESNEIDTKTSSNATTEITGVERMKALAGDMIDDIISTDKHTRIYESYDEFIQVFKDFPNFKEYKEAFTVVINRHRSDYKIIVLREENSFSAYWERATIEDIIG